MADSLGEPTQEFLADDSMETQGSWEAGDPRPAPAAEGEGGAHGGGAENGGGEEGEEDEEDDGGEATQEALMEDTRTRRSAFVEREVEEENEESEGGEDMEGGDDDDDDDDDEEDGYVLNDFTVPDDMEGDSGEVGATRRKVRKKDDLEKYVPLEEDEVQLVREAQGSKRKKGLRRLKRRDGEAEFDRLAPLEYSEEEEAGEGEDDGERGEGRSRRDHTATSQQEEGAAEAPGQKRYSTMREEDERPNKKQAMEGDSVTAQQLADYKRLFGESFLDSMSMVGDDEEEDGDYQVGNDMDLGEDALAPLEDDDGEFGGDDSLGAAGVDAHHHDDDASISVIAYGPRKQTVPLKNFTQVLKERFEPSMLEGEFLTDKDLAIARMTVPERFQLAVPNRPYSNDRELSEEAHWIFQAITSNDTYQQLRNMYGLRGLMDPQSIKGRSFVDSKEVLSYTKRIFNVLFFLRRNMHEIPMQLQYQKEHYLPLCEEDMWAIYDYDLKWYHLKHGKKKKLQALYGNPDKMRELGVNGRYFDLIKESNTESDVSDLYDYFTFQFPQVVQEQQQQSDGGGGSGSNNTNFKAPVVRDAYAEAKNAGLKELSDRFGITSAQFGDNLWHQELDHVPLTAADGITPEEAAEEWMVQHPEACKQWTRDDVLAKARLIAAKEIALDPHVRSALRNEYNAKAVVFTFPTEKGMEEIDYFHKYREVKRLDNMPLAEFYANVRFATLMEAEAAGFIEIEIHIPDPLESMAQLYLNTSDTSEAGQKWNEQRKEILLEALGKYLHPRFRFETRQKLERITYDNICAKVSEQLKKRLLSKPLARPPQAAHEYDEQQYEFSRNKRLDGTSVLAFNVPTDYKQAVFATILDRDGELQEYVKLSFILAPNRSEHQAALFNDDCERLRELIKSHRPGVVGIGVCEGAVDSSKLKKRVEEDVLDSVRNYLYENPPAVVPDVFLIDGRAARLMRAASIAAKEFPSYSPPLLQSISVGRLMLDPFSEYSRLYADGDSISRLVLHPYQHLVPVTLLQSAMERCFLSAVRLIGVDINDAWRHPHLSHTLQFVPGLGPRKAKRVLRRIWRTAKAVESREEFCSLLRDTARGADDNDDDLGEAMDGDDVGDEADTRSNCIYENCGGFIRITQKHFSYEPHPLDDTRIHPHSYGFAYKIAHDAVDDADEDEELDEHRGKEYVSRVIGQREKLQEINIEEFARMWQEDRGEDKRATINDIMTELMYPYADRRHAASSLDTNQLFNIVMQYQEGDIMAQSNIPRGFKTPLSEGLVVSDTSLMPGRLIDVKIARLLNHAALCFMDSGLRGMIQEMNVSDDTSAQLSDLLSEGEIVTCRILSIDKDRFQVELSCRRGDLNDVDGHFTEDPRDVERRCPYLKWAQCEEERRQLLESKAAREKRKRKLLQKAKKVVNRVVDHPQFLNVNMKEALQQLEGKAVGEAIFRPSSKGNDHLTLSFVCAPNRVAHIDIKESDKPDDMSLGQVLTVAGAKEKFEDLDHILSRYVAPITHNTERLLAHHRYFEGEGGREEVETQLKNRKQANPAEIPYCISVHPKYDGWFMIYFVPNQRVHSFPITIRPDGFRLRSRTFQSVSKMLAWFKRHWNDQDTQSRTSTQRRRRNKRVDRSRQ